MSGLENYYKISRRIAHLKSGAGLDDNIIHVHGAEAAEVGWRSEEVRSVATEVVLPHGGCVVAVVTVPPQPPQLLVQFLEAGYRFVAGVVDEDLPPG